VTGLPTSICPECGSDLDEVGTRAPEMPLSASPLFKCLIWTFCLCIIAFLITALGSTLLPREKRMRTSFDLVESQTSASDIEVACEVIELAYENRRISSSGSILFRRTDSQGSPAMIEVRLPQQTYRTFDAAGKELERGQTLGIEVLDRFVNQGSTTAKPKMPDNRAEELRSIVSNAVAGAHPTRMLIEYDHTSENTASHVGPPQYFVIVSGVFWLIVWLLGIWFIMKPKRAKRAVSSKSVE
jgi:hypothetical protein